jgi:hypothetical protein
VPDDRLDDLGRAPHRREELDELDGTAPPGSAAERFSHDDDREPDTAPSPAQHARPYVIAAGLLLVVLVVLAVLAPGLVCGPSTGSESVRGPRPGQPLPEFAAPLATGALDGDVNITPSGLPPGAPGRPACEVRGPGVVNLCDLREHPLAIIFVVREGTRCESEIGVFDRVAREHPKIEFLVVVSGEERAAVEQLVRSRAWSVPVAVDPDGALVNLYRVGVCPTTIFALPGGRVLETRLGSLSEAQLNASVRRLEQRSGGG